jgi:hypothetical protein
MNAAFEWPEGHGVGIDCGKSGLFVVDCDNHKDEKPRAPFDLPTIHTGDDAFAFLWETLDPAWQPGSAGSRFYPRADCGLVLTPSGGTHYYFRDPVGDLRNTADRLAWQVDTRGAGGFVVAPGTLTTAGLYEVVNWPSQLPEVPEWLRGHLAPRKPVERPRKAAKTMFAPDGPELSGVSGPELAGLVKAVRNAESGKRNDVLNWSAWKLAEKGELDDGTAAILKEAAVLNGLTEDEAEKTIQSARRRGKGK